MVKLREIFFGQQYNPVSSGRQSFFLQLKDGGKILLVPPRLYGCGRARQTALSTLVFGARGAAPYEVFGGWLMAIAVANARKVSKMSRIQNRGRTRKVMTMRARMLIV